MSTWLLAVVIGHEKEQNIFQNVTVPLSANLSVHNQHFCRATDGDSTSYHQASDATLPLIVQACWSNHIRTVPGHSVEAVAAEALLIEKATALAAVTLAHLMLDFMCRAVNHWFFINFRPTKVRTLLEYLLQSTQVRQVARAMQPHARIHKKGALGTLSHFFDRCMCLRYFPPKEWNLPTPKRKLEISLSKG